MIECHLYIVHSELKTHSSNRFPSSGNTESLIMVMKEEQQQICEWLWKTKIFLGTKKQTSGWKHEEVHPMHLSSLRQKNDISKEC